MISEEASPTLLQISFQYIYISRPFQNPRLFLGWPEKRNATTTELLAEAEGKGGKPPFFITRTARNSGVGGKSLKLEGQRNN